MQIKSLKKTQLEIRNSLLIIKVIFRIKPYNFQVPEQIQVKYLYHHLMIN